MSAIKDKIMWLKYCFQYILNDTSIIIVYIKHISSIIYRKRFLASFVSLLLLIAMVFYALLSWGIVCSNVEVWQHVHNVCHQYHDGDSVGNLCQPLCEHGRIHNMNCQPLHAGKEVVFSAVLDGMPLVFKSSKRKSTPDIRTSVYWLDTKGYQHYPSENEFFDMITNLVVTEMNISVTNEQIQKLTQLGPVPIRSEVRHTEMNNLWALLQDHEYLAIRIFAEQEIFPTLIGSCGEYFAVEYAEPIPSGIIWDHENEIWSERLRNAVLILELIERLESTPMLPLRLCDVRLNHFGKSFDGTKVVILDGDSVVTNHVANTLSGDGQTCKQHKDCHYLDCYAECKYDKCISPSTNNNLQTICEKVFLGEKWGGSLLLPGLLSSPHASPALTSLLRLCAYPHGEDGIKYGTPDDVRDRLVATVEEMLNELDMMVE